MSPEELERFNKANEAVHKVEDQWHYKYLVPAGFVPETKEAVGFVRNYIYRHPDGRVVTASTGYSADHWSSSDGNRGYWSDLEKYCKQ